jgi:putative transposase
MAEDTRGVSPRRWAELRFSVVGPLLASPPDKGELQAAIEELASRRWRHPQSGDLITFGASTIERWYAAARATDDPIAALTSKARKDRGTNKAMSTALLEALVLQHKAHPGWSYTLHADNLAALAEERPAIFGPAPSYATVRRRMVERGLRRRRTHRHPTRGQQAALERLERLEVRSFEASHAHALWHYDFHEGRRKVALLDGSFHVPVLLGILDDRSRLCCHLQWYLSESAENLFHGLAQAYLKRGLPRAEMHDNGGAMGAAEIVAGGSRLGIEHQPTLPYSPYQNGKQEAFWGGVEGRLMAMLERVEPLTLDLLNRATAAWVEADYNREVHSELGVTPLARLLDSPDVSRPSPDLPTLRLRFTQSRHSTQRQSDGTVSIHGVRFELPSHLRFCRKVPVRFQRWDLSVAYVVDERTDDPIARIFPIDPERNASGHRRSLEPEPVAPRAGLDLGELDPMPPLLRKIMAEHAATGLPPAYMPKDELVAEPDDQGAKP